SCRPHRRSRTADGRHPQRHRRLPVAGVAFEARRARARLRRVRAALQGERRMAEGYRKKLIEVAIQLDDINRESAREKSIRHGHPSTLHLWWARRPLASARAVLFCSLIDDPGEEGVPPGLLARIDELPRPQLPPEEWEALDEAEQRRRRLFQF